VNSLYQILFDLAFWTSLFFIIFGLAIESAFIISPKDGSRFPFDSVLGWFFPIPKDSSSFKPVFSIISSLFRLYIFLTPILILAHNFALQDIWGWSFPIMINEKLADYMTIAAICCAFILLARALALSEIRKHAGRWEYVLFFFITASLLTGYLATHQIGGNYELILTLHIIMGQILLILIPLARLSHYFLKTQRHVLF